MEHILQPGDPCRDCARLGLKKYLRYFYINLEDKILKCESNQCLYPYEDDEEYIDNTSEVKNQPAEDAALFNFTVDDGTQLIDELLKQSVQFETEFTLPDSYSTKTETHAIQPELHTTQLCNSQSEFKEVKSYFTQLDPKPTQFESDSKQFKTESTQFKSDSIQLQTETTQSRSESDFPLITSSRTAVSCSDFEKFKEERPETFTITNVENVGNWIQCKQVWESSGATATQNKTLRSVANTNLDASTSAQEVTAGTRTSEDIPKARIKRFLDVIDMHKKPPQLQQKKKRRTQTRFRHQIIIKKEPEADSGGDEPTLVKPLDIIRGILGSKSK